MALTNTEISTIKSIVKNIRIKSEYFYDEQYSENNSLSKTNNILKSINLSLTLDDIQDLTINNKFKITKRTILKLGERLLADSNIDDDNTTKFCTIILLWGYASQGYGEYRITQMLSHDSIKGNFNKNIVSSLNAIRNNNINLAYNSWLFENKINRLGEAFFTKILYFVSKIVNNNNPCIAIKDSITSTNVAMLFKIPRIRKRGLKSFLDYIEVLGVVAKETNTTIEDVEEFLFSNTEAITEMIEKNELINYSFPFGDDFVREMNPPVIIPNKTYQEFIPNEDGTYKIMLIADGKPQSKLPEMSYGSSLRNLLDNFYTPIRQNVICEGYEKASQCYVGTFTCIMTTGFGAVPIAMSIPLYNILGERSIRQRAYWRLYEQSIISILPPSSDDKKVKISIVYYAGKSQRPFREGIAYILQNSKAIKKKYNIHFCMYGAIQHPIDKWGPQGLIRKNNWGSLCDIFNNLEPFNRTNLIDMQTKWKKSHNTIAPFFDFF